MSRVYKKEFREPSDESSRLRAPNRAVLEPILKDLDRLYEMRYWIPDPNNPI